MKIVDKEFGWFFETETLMLTTFAEQDVGKKVVVFGLKLDILKKPIWSKSVFHLKYTDEPNDKKTKYLLNILNTHVSHSFKEMGYIDIEEIRTEMEPFKRGDDFD